MAGSEAKAGKAVLYHSFPFRSCRCAWLVSELGIEDEVIMEKVSLHGASANLDEYEKVHPYRTIPALRLPSGETILESGAICLYFADIYAEKLASLELLPSATEKASYYNWILHATSTVDQILDPLYMQLTHTPEEKRNNELITEKKKKFAIFAKTLNSHLTGKEFICGDNFTTADCVIGYNVWWASIINKGILLEDYPEIQAYKERICARNAWKKVFCRATKPSGGSL